MEETKIKWYDKDYICCYNNTDVFTEEEIKILTEDDKMFVRDALYRQDLLNIFCLEIFDDDKILFTVRRIFESVKNEKIIQTLIDSVQEIQFQEDNLLKFMSLFSYEHLYKTHQIISNLI